MAATARAYILSRLTDLSPKRVLHPPQPPPLQVSRHGCFLRRRSGLSAASFAGVSVSCLSGGDYVSTRRSDMDRGFAVIANMLKRIEPLDTSVISKGVSDSAKDSMKQTISTMLGLLPSDQFSVTIRVSKQPLDRLLISSIVTGYTLWNAEYRISLMRNFEISVDSSKKLDNSKQSEIVEAQHEETGSGSCGDGSIEELGQSPRLFGDLSPAALNYIQQLQSELSTIKEELNAQEQEIMQIESDRESRNDLLEYLRSLDSDMVAELSRPSSLEVEDIIHQLVRNTMRKFFKDDINSSFMGDSGLANTGDHQDADNEFCNTIGTSRDYLAKLLFWCMLLGHHLRGLENRLHLSCAVGLL